MFRPPEDTYRAYERFLRKRNFRKAYQCLESLLHQFPDHEAFLVDLVNLAYFEWDNYEAARPWLVKLTRLRSFLKDYLLLSEGEAKHGDIVKAKKYLEEARSILERGASARERKEAKAFLLRQEDLIKSYEWRFASKAKINQVVLKDENKASSPIDSAPSQPPLMETASRKPVQEPSKGRGPETEERKKSPPPPQCSVSVQFSVSEGEALKTFQPGSFSTLEEIKLLIDYTHLMIQSGFDELLCLNAINGVDRYWYQIETVKKVLKYFRGRALLCDEVGLGKTIEAGMVIKEYLMRGMIRNVLILTPSSLVSQWKEESETKFDLSFKTTEEMAGHEDPEMFWKEKYLIASLHTAKNKKNFPFVTRQFYDLVVVDEIGRAHV